MLLSVIRYELRVKGFPLVIVYHVNQTLIRIFMAFVNAQTPGLVKIVRSIPDNVVIDVCNHALGHHGLTEINVYHMLLEM